MPVFDREGVALVAGEMTGSTIPEPATGNRFIRTVRLIPILGITTLKRTIEIADELHAEVAAISGAHIPDHIWGYIKSDRPSNHSGDSLIPAGFELGADVEYIYNSQKPDAAGITTLSKTIADYFHAGSNEHYWADASAHQFINGFSAISDSDGLWQPDIDILFLPRNTRPR